MPKTLKMEIGTLFDLVPAPALWVLAMLAATRLAVWLNYSSTGGVPTGELPSAF